MFGDLRYSLRNFRKSPGFVAVAVLVLALGIGANTAIFTVVNAALLHAFPFANADRIVMVWEKNPMLGDFLAERVPVNLANFLVWQHDSKSFENMGVFVSTRFTISGDQNPEQIEGAKSSANLAEVFGVHPMLGRTFTADECAPGRDHVAVISHAYFVKHFGSNPDVLDRTLRLNHEEYKIIGVWPPSFHLPGTYEGLDQKKPMIWIPADLRPDQPKQALENRDKEIYALRKPGVSLQQARAEMAVIGSRLEKEHPDYNRGFNVAIWTIAQEDVGPNMRTYVLLLQGAVGFVLLIACANVANLMLARAIARRKELAVRLALGATRWRLMRQMFTESLLLACAAGAAGGLLAMWGIRAIDALAPSDSPHLHELTLDLPALFFTLIVALATGIIFGLAPAFDAGKRNVNDALTQGGRSGSSGISARYRGMLVSGEVALALILLVGAGLLIRTVQAMLAVDQGFKRDHLLTVSLALPDAKYGKPSQIDAFGRELLEHVMAIPGVSSASLASGLPLQNLQERTYNVDGRPKPDPAPMTNARSVDENYFRTMAIQITRGRAFTTQEVDDENSTPILVNQTIAKLVWPGEEPLGRRLSVSNRSREVVGVVADARQLGPETKINPEIYLPARAQQQMTLAVRTTQEPKQLGTPVSKAVWAIDKEQPIGEISTMDEALAGWTGEKRFVMVLLAAFAALALLLAAAGIYGVLAYSVSQRTREIGIRMAIGASARDVLSMVIREGLLLSGIGIVIGIAGAMALTRLLRGLVFGVSATDPWTFAAGIAVLGIAAVLASLIPARRASSLAPLDALRDE